MIGVLVMAYGGPGNVDEVEPYLLDVRNYRPTSEEIIQEVRQRYQQIGGRSPILERTQAQAECIQTALDRRGSHFKAFVGMRHWKPFIKDALAEISACNIDRVVGLVMAPHYSQMSIGAYFKKIEEANKGLDIARIDHWHMLSGYLEALTGQVESALERFPASVRHEVPVIFTAHSLPERILTWGDPYPEELQLTVQAVAERLNGQPYTFAYQSAAISNESWLGPDVSEVISDYVAQGRKYVLIAPVGFVCEHVEILYDIDIVYKKQAEELGMHLERTEMLNTSPQMIEGLADLVFRTAQEMNWL